MINRILSTQEKALAFNLNTSTYGTFAEIGGGQEVANQFFKAGGASGTIAKTLSAYDMAVSDYYYGKTKRYVSKDRLTDMINKEYENLTYYLSEKADNKCFFSLANTIETLNFKKTNQGQGWMGVKFQSSPNSTPNVCKIHFLLNDNNALLQQETIGILGVNILNGLYNFNSVSSFLKALVDNIDQSRIEINYLELTGPDFSNIDNRLISLELVKNDLTEVAMFGSNKDILQPLNVLYKQDLLVLRGRFKPPTKVNLDMFNAGLKQLDKSKNIARHNVTCLAELTLNNLLNNEQDITQDFLSRADLLCELGYTVLVSNFKYHYELTDYLNKKVKTNSIHLVMGLGNFKQIFDKKLHQNPDEIFRGISSLFKEKSGLLIYPELSNNRNKTITIKDIKIDKFDNLIKHLLENNQLIEIENFNKEVLPIYSKEVLRLIQDNNESWKKMVPEKITNTILEEKLFQVPS